MIFRRELASLGARTSPADIDRPEDDGGATLLPVPPWITIAHVVFMAWIVFTAHYAALFLGGFLFFLGFVKATAPF